VLSHPGEARVATGEVDLELVTLRLTARAKAPRDEVRGPVLVDVVPRQHEAAVLGDGDAREFG
jgi:hypothetical protein